jgi:hypothetical protein
VKSHTTNKVCLFRITGRDRKQLEDLLFKRYPAREWGTFFRFGYRVTEWGLHVTFVELFPPRGSDLDERSWIVEFSASYILRAQLSTEQDALGVGVIHSHPQGFETSASSLDMDMDGYFAAEFATYGDGRPYVSLRLGGRKDGQIRFSGEAWLNGEKIPVTEFLTVDAQPERLYSESTPERNFHRLDSGESLDRVRQLLGDRNVSRLPLSCVGIVGCSGLGSPAAHVLARGGVGRFVLVDPKCFSRSNHERCHASSFDDLGKGDPKVELVQRMIRKINPSAEVTMIQGNALDEIVLDELLRCDLLLGCTDSQYSRATLSDFATHYLLPCIDAAVLMRATKGILTEQVAEFARYSPEEPCAWCLGRINQKALWYELMSEEERTQRRIAARAATDRGVDGEQYWGGEPPMELTVGYMTSTVGSMQAGFAQGMITGSFCMPHQRFQFDLGMPSLGVVPADKEPNPDCSCRRTKGWSDQARADRSVSRPSHFGKSVVIRKP